MRYRYKGEKTEVVIIVTLGIIEIVRCHAATSTIHKTGKGEEEKDKDEGEKYIPLRSQIGFYGNLTATSFARFIYFNESSIVSYIKIFREREREIKILH